MNVNIICIGKIKEKYLKDAMAEYSKRLSHFCRLNVLELPDEAMSDKPQDAEICTVLKKEGERILPFIKSSDVVISLCIEGKQLSSEEFAHFFEKETLVGKSTFTFIIGGSLGLLNEIKKKSNLMLSFSRMTLPHQLMRVVLLEQIYRAFKISANESYHK